MRVLSHLLLLLALSGCGAPGAAVVEVPPSVPRDQLVPTLQRIAETGDYYEVLGPLTAGLEEAGYMTQAAEIQEFAELSSKPERIKALAVKVAASIK